MKKNKVDEMTNEQVIQMTKELGLKFINGMEIDTISKERTDEVQRLVVSEFVYDQEEDNELSLMVPTIELITLACKVLGHLNPELLKDEVRELFETTDEEIQEMKDNWEKHLKDNEQN